LRPATTRHAAGLGPDAFVGELLRPAGDDDLAAGRAMAGRASALLERAGRLAAEAGLPLAPLDAEVLLDGGHARVFYLRLADCDVRELVAPLSREFGLTLTPVDLTARRAPEGGCGSCGAGGCGGCGEGGCGKGSCHPASPEEVRAYFAGLRRKMEE